MERLSREIKAIVRLKFPNEKFVALVMDSLGPEAASSSVHRSKVCLSHEGEELTFTFEAEDTTALRASMNTYLRWLQLLNNIYETLESR